SIASIVGSKQRIGGSAPSLRKIFASLTHAKRSQRQLSSCFLIYMKDDSIEGIYDTLKECAVISKSAGGIGVSVHNICATGSYIRGNIAILMVYWARREEQIQAAHDEAMFGASTLPPPTSTDSELERKNEKEVDKKAVDTSLLSEN
ncbi:hypothetical protein S83_015637, partial [Arachis hypogaea]